MDECWYDLEFDRDLIEASFAMQYGIRLGHKDGEEITLSEFFRLLRGLMPETPLGQIVSIRCEKDLKRIRRFGESERRIRAEWKRFRSGSSEPKCSAQEWDRSIHLLQNVLGNMFGGGCFGGD